MKVGDDDGVDEVSEAPGAGQQPELRKAPRVPALHQRGEPFTKYVMNHLMGISQGLWLIARGRSRLCEGPADL